MCKMTIEEALYFVAESPDGKVNGKIMEIMGWSWKSTPKKGVRWSKPCEKTLWRTPNIVGRYDLFLKFCVEWMKENESICAYHSLFLEYYYDGQQERNEDESIVFAPMNERVALFLVAFG